MDIGQFLHDTTIQVREQLILVEGPNDENLFLAILRQEGLDDRCQVLHYRSAGELSNVLALLVRDARFPAVRRIGLTRDSDNGAEAAIQSLSGAWKNARAEMEVLNIEMPAPFFFALPDNRTKGRIEDICLRSVSGTANLLCAQEMLECALASGIGPRDREKALVAAYLSIMESPGLPLGVGAQRGYWKLESDAFRPLREFVRLVAST